MELVFSVESIGGERRQPLSASVQITRLYNFGYTGRNIEAVQEHIDELANLGLPAPKSVPALFQLAPRLGTTEDTVVVSGNDSYGEVEYALVRADDGEWYVTVASDHSDLAIEKISTSRSKSVYPDVLGSTVWPLDEVLDDWDGLVLRNSRTDEFGTEIIQESPASAILPPQELISILKARTGGEIPAGTIVLSGTVGGIPESGAVRWEVSLRDSVRQRVITHAYRVEALPDELS